MVKLDIQLSEHFTLREMCASETAQRQKLPNIPGPGHIMKMKNLLQQTLEPARRHFQVPFRITSGYRCQAVNMLVGGAPNSQHQRGEAVDFQLIPGAASACASARGGLPAPDSAAAPGSAAAPLSLRAVFEWMRDNVPYDQLIWEHGRWIHVSLHIDPKLNRHEVLEVQ